MFGSRHFLEQLVTLQQEQNALLRELLLALGRKPMTPRATDPPKKIYTDADVIRVTRETSLEQEREALTKTQAPWRTTLPPLPTTTGNGGPATAPTPPPSGFEPKVTDPGVSPNIKLGRLAESRIGDSAPGTWSPASPKNAESS